MQTTEKPRRARKSPRRDLRTLLSTRSGTALVAGVSALLAAALLMVFLKEYRASVSGGDDLRTVLVAKNLIEKSSSGDVIAEKGIFQTTRVKKRELKDGAIADPSQLRGKVAADDIYPGEQLVISDFVDSTGGVRQRIGGDERAIAIPIDSAHGMVGNVQAGDHVDVLGGFNVNSGGTVQNRPVVKTLLQDAVVLRAPAKPSDGATAGPSSQNVVVRATDTQAAELAFAADNGKVWIVLRPKAGAKQNKPSLITLERLLFDVKPVDIQRLARAARSRR